MSHNFPTESFIAASADLSAHSRRGFGEKNNASKREEQPRFQIIPKNLCGCLPIVQEIPPATNSHVSRKLSASGPRELPLSRSSPLRFTVCCPPVWRVFCA